MSDVAKYRKNGTDNKTTDFSNIDEGIWKRRGRFNIEDFSNIYKEGGLTREEGIWKRYGLLQHR